MRYINIVNINNNSECTIRSKCTCRIIYRKNKYHIFNTLLTHIKKEGKLIDINIQVLIIKSKSVTVRSLTRLTRREPPVEQELPTLSEHLSTLSVFSGIY
jgi:hypothetical protein